MENIYQIIGQRIKELRITANLTQEELAEQIGLQPRSISRLETGKTFLSGKVLIKLSSIFKVSEDYFFKRYDNHKKNDETLLNDIKNSLRTLDAKQLKKAFLIIDIFNIKD